MLTSEDFRIIVTDTLQHELGYVDDPDDPGGETKFGISKRSYPHLDISSLTIEEAIEIYREDYWRKPRIERLADFSLARKVFDLAVNTGQVTAVMMLQRAINTVCTGQVAPRRRAAWRQAVVRALKGKPLRVDGIIGPITLSVLSACPHAAALRTALRGEAYAYYKIGDPLYIPGWLERLAS
jgi:lysozyme family protein